VGRGEDEQSISGSSVSRPERASPLRRLGGALIDGLLVAAVGALDHRTNAITAAVDLDPEEAFRALMKVDSESEPVEGDDSE
jgi:hypothetical protein